MTTMGALEVFGAAGHLDVLSVGRGHLRIEVNEDDPEGMDRARRIIENMLTSGFAIFVEEPDGTTKRVKKFNPKKMTYIVDDTTDTKEGAKLKGKAPKKEVPVAQAKATAVGRTAGG